MSLQVIPKKTFKNPHGTVAVIASQYHRSISDNLLKAFKEEIKPYSGIEVEVFEVPGAFEIPLKAQEIAEGKYYAVIVALGAIVKGETYHFEQVASESARGCMDVMLKFGIPVVYEVLSVYHLDDAVKRSEGEYNHGRFAAYTALYWLERS